MQNESTPIFEIVSCGCTCKVSGFKFQNQNTRAIERPCDQTSAHCQEIDEISTSAGMPRDEYWRFFFLVNDNKQLCTMNN